MNPRKSAALAILSLFLLSGFGTGCGAINKLMGKSPEKKQQSKQEDQKKDKQKIGVILAANKEETPQIKKGLLDAAKKEGAELVFLDPKAQGQEEEGKEEKGGKEGKDKEKKDEGQEEQKKESGKKDEKKSGEDTKDLKAVIIQGGGPVPEMVKTLAKKKIPIVAIGSAGETKVEGIVTADNFRIGEMQGDFVKSKLPQGNVVLLQAGDPGAEEVIAGNKTSLAQSPGLKIVQTFASPTKNSSPTAAFDDYLKKNPAGVQAVIASDSKLAMETIEVLKKNNLNKKVMVVGAGTHKEALSQIASGDLHADVDKSPYLQGLYAYKMASGLAKKQTTDADRTVVTESGETPAKIVPIQLVRPENMSQFQKIYSQPQVSPEEEEQTPDKDKKKGEQGKQTANKEANQKQGQQGGQQQGQSLKTSGVTQIREKIRTETTREMLGPDGKVMGTETEVKEEVRTLPSALVDARKQQQAEQEKKQDKGEKKEEEGKDQKEKDGEGDKDKEDK